MAFKKIRRHGEHPSEDSVTFRPLKDLVKDLQERDLTDHALLQIQIWAPELVVPPLEPAPRKSPAKKGAPPKIRLRAMGNVEPWGADEYSRTLRVDVGLLQLLLMCPSARSGVVNGVRLEPPSQRPKARVRNQAKDASERAVPRPAARRGGENAGAGAKVGALGGA